MQPPPKNLQYLELHENDLTGTLPVSLARLQDLVELRLNSNRLHGPVPVLLGERLMLKEVDLSSNDVSGELPLFKSPDLQTLDVSRTQMRLPQAMVPPAPSRHCHMQWFHFGGGVTEKCPTLLSYSLRTVHRSSAVHLSSISDSASNRVRPSRFVILTTAHTVLCFSYCACQVDLVPPRSAFGETVFVIGAALYPVRPPGALWSVRLLYMDECPLALDARDFLHIVGAFRELVRISARNANLRGDVPLEWSRFVPYLQPDSTTSTGFSDTGSFPRLVFLDLHGNELTSIKAPPPGALVAADFSANDVVEVAAEWFEQLYQLSLEETGLRGEARWEGGPLGGTGGPKSKS